METVLYCRAMKLHTTPVRWIAQFLLAAVFLQALAPAWAATTRDDRGSWSEVCTTAGSKWIKQSAQHEDQSSVDHASSHKHCVFCSSTGASDSFDVSKLLAHHTNSKVISEPALLFIEVFSGHSILSRAPPL